MRVTGLETRGGSAEIKVRNNQFLLSDHVLHQPDACRDPQEANTPISLHACGASPTYPPVDVVAALLKLLLDLLLQEVDPQLQAEVLLLQVVQVLRDGAITPS